MWLKELHFKSFLWCLLATKLLAQTTCDDVEKVKVTFYGYPDNTPPGPNIRCLLSSRSDCTGCPTNSSSSTTATHCGPRGETAGGTGTYNDPITMASAATWFCHQEVVYMPFLQKYVRYEDFCADCIGNATIGVRHIDIWTGSTTINGGRLQDKCERLLTPNTMQAMIRNPPPNLTVDVTSLFVPPEKGVALCSGSTITGSGTKSSVNLAQIWMAGILILELLLNS